jgi:hypothetical protein
MSLMVMDFIKLGSHFKQMADGKETIITILVH